MKKNKENVLVLGRAGVGRVSHPWDYLPKCDCGSKLLMVHEDKTLYVCGEKNKEDIHVYCSACDKILGKFIWR